MVNICKNRTIKFAWRRNLIYPIQLLIWTFLRKVITIILSKEFNFSQSVIFTLLMFLGEFFAGLILFHYQRSFLIKKETQSKSKEILIYSQNEMKQPDSNIKILFLIFFSGYFDFIEFILSTNYIPKFIKSSGSLENRLGGILTISSALFFYYLLKLPIFRHQFFSLLIIGICLIIVIITEFIFQETNIFLTYGDFLLKILLIFFVHFFNSLLDSIEKYIVEYNFVNYFQVLCLEGLFGFLITFAYSFSEDLDIKQLSKIYSENSGGQFALFIFLLFVYLVFCGGRNAFRVVTNKLYSPMTKTLTDYVLNPVYLTINYIEGDFVSRGRQNIIYFLINLIMSIIITLCGSVYNEIVVLFFCGLENDTYDQVSERSSLNYIQELPEVDPIDDSADNNVDIPDFYGSIESNIVHD